MYPSLAVKKLECKKRIVENPKDVSLTSGDVVEGLRDNWCKNELNIFEWPTGRIERWPFGYDLFK